MSITPRTRICGDDAFSLGPETLASRAEKPLGPLAPSCRMGARPDAVFSNCKERRPCRRPHRAAPARCFSSPIRAYQIAAAHIYAGDFDEAAGAFPKDSRPDIKSPWRALPAAYLGRPRVPSVRPRSRIPERRRPFNDPKSSSAEFWPTPSLAAVHAPARRLLRLRTAACRSGRPSGGAWSRDRETRRPGNPASGTWGITDSCSTSSRATTKMQSLALRTSLPIGCGNYGDPALCDRALASTQIVALAARVAGPHADGDPAVPELLKAADRIRPDSPGYASVRLLFETGCSSNRDGSRKLGGG